MDHVSFVEVVGETERRAAISRLHATLRISLHDEASTGHAALARLDALKSEALKALSPMSEVGLSTVDRGSELNRYERRRKDPIGHSTIGLILRDSRQITEATRLVEAQVSADDTTALMVAFDRPEFEPIDRTAALLEAVSDARNKADAIAHAAEGVLGRVLSAVEVAPKKRDSGALGDPDYWGDEERFHVGGANEQDGMQTPIRTYYIFVRVRFELVHTAAQQIG